ncbi:MAG: hypothetical protein WCE38_22350 [Burkholderiales bacterium]
MWKFVGTLMIGIAVAGLAGCRSAPVMDIVDAPVVESAGGQKLTADQVKLAIQRAGATLGWQIKEVQPFLLEGTLILRDHVAVVNIPYSAERYSIVYKDSKNLNYDGKSIHSNYNGWVQNLDRAIKVQLGIR